MCTIFEIGELRPLNSDRMRPIHHFNEDVVWFDI
jgi:hypothetical protein